VVKNKVAPPFRETEFDIIYGKVVSSSGELIDMAVDHGIVDKSGAWFSYASDRLGQGRENAKRFLDDTPEVAQEILTKVKGKLGIGPEPQTEEA
jgi:recombination protein RecA